MNSPTSETHFNEGDKIWWYTPGMAHRAIFLGMSASGKRARIRYEYKMNDITFTQSSFVEPKNIEHRHE